MNWTEQFNVIQLFEYRCIGRYVPNKTERTMEVDDFFAFQVGYRNKALSVIKKIWHRGCILIAKKFKSFGSKSFEAWTFSGYQ